MNITTWERPDWDALRVLTDAPHIHIHYLMTDAQSDIEGFGRTELCCHVCGAARILSYNVPAEENALLPQRQSFVADHERCRGPQFTALCPLDRSVTTHVDLREPRIA